jgi:ABC-type sugar transport system ATPase subunit
LGGGDTVEISRPSGPSLCSKEVHSWALSIEVQVRDEDKGVLLISADLDEIMRLSDRIAVMYEGEFLGVGKAEELSREEAGMMMGGIRPD